LLFLLIFPANRYAKTLNRIVFSIYSWSIVLDQGLINQFIHDPFITVMGY